jgi:hypothetical protein
VAGDTVHPQQGKLKFQQAQEVFVAEVFMGRSKGAERTHFWSWSGQRCDGAAGRWWAKRGDSGGRKKTFPQVEVKRKSDVGSWPGVGGGCRSRHRRGRGMGEAWVWHTVVVLHLDAREEKREREKVTDRWAQAMVCDRHAGSIGRRLTVGLRQQRH